LFPLIYDKQLDSRRKAMVKRIFGVLMFRSATYREIAKDPAATRQAAVIVAISILVQGFFQGFVITGPGGAPVRSSLSGGIAGAIAQLISGFITWILAAWILALIIKLFKGQTNTGEMLRITGYVEIFGLLTFLTVLALVSPSLASVTEILVLIIGLLGFFGYIVGIVEVSGLTTGKAFVASLIAELITLVVTITIAGFLMSLFWRQ
jgi:hypothetical protein